MLGKINPHNANTLLHGFFVFFNDTATTEIYTLSLHDALPISKSAAECSRWNTPNNLSAYFMSKPAPLSRTMKARPPFASTEANWTRGCGCFAVYFQRSEEHTSELQSRLHLVCRLLLEKKKYKS